MITYLYFLCGVAFVGFVDGQFHQDQYEIIHDKINILDYNHTAVERPTVHLFKYNETIKMKAINCSAYFTPGVKKNILVNFSVYKFVKGKYRAFPFPPVDLDICEEFTKNPFGIQAAFRNTNFKGCPCAVGFYYLADFVLEEDKFPPHIPFGEYKLDIKMKVDDTIYMIHAEWLGRVVPKGSV